MIRKIRVIDYLFCAYFLIPVAVIVGCYFIEETSQSWDYLFEKFYSDKGVQILEKFFTILFTITGSTILFSIIKRQFNRSRLIILLISLFLIIAGVWFRMWYTSTFYYGEIRDKQGSWFPISALLCSFYFISLLPIKATKYNWLKWVICIATTALFVGVFELVKEPWHLWSRSGYF